MSRELFLAGLAATLLTSAAHAADPLTEQPNPPEQAAQRGVLVFQPDFFAAQRPNTALDMVQRVPGFSVQDGSGARGFEGAVGNILINGARPASKNDTGSNVLSRTIAGRVERIELIRGGAPGVDMQGYSVVVNVILKKATSRQSILTWNTTQFDGGQDLYGGSYQFTATDGEKSWGVSLSDGISSSDANGPGVNIRRDGSGKPIREESFLNDSWGGNRGIRGNYSGPLAGGKIEATARFGVNDWQQWQALVSSVADRRSNYAEEGQSGEFGLTYTRPLAPNWALETRAIHTFEAFDNASTSTETLGGTASPQQRFTADGDSSETILRAQVRHDWSKAVTFEAGGEVAYNVLDVTQAYSVGGAAVPLPSASLKVEELRGEGFSKATWRINPRLTIEGGLRLETSTIKQSGDADNEKNFFYAKPRFLATWTPAANSQVRIRFERELGQLDFGDFAASAELDDDSVYGGNVDLKPEQRWISEIGYERRFWGEGIVSIAYRHDEIVGVIDRLPLAGNLSATGNIGDGKLDRLSVNIVVPTDRAGLKGGRITFKNDWDQTEVKDPTTGRTRPISGVRPTLASVGFQQDLTRYKVQWGVNWLPLLIDRNYNVDQVVNVRGSGYTQVFAEYKPTSTLSVRTQLTLWDDFNVERTVFSNRAPDRAVAFVESRMIDPRTFATVRVRKTF